MSTREESKKEYEAAQMILFTRVSDLMSHTSEAALKKDAAVLQQNLTMLTDVFKAHLTLGNYRTWKNFETKLDSIFAPLIKDAETFEVAAGALNKCLDIVLESIDKKDCENVELAKYCDFDNCRKQVLTGIKVYFSDEQIEYLTDKNIVYKLFTAQVYGTGEFEKTAKMMFDLQNILFENLKESPVSLQVKDDFLREAFIKNLNTRYSGIITYSGVFAYNTGVYMLKNKIALMKETLAIVEEKYLQTKKDTALSKAAIQSIAGLFAVIIAIQIKAELNGIDIPHIIAKTEKNDIFEDKKQRWRYILEAAFLLGLDIEKDDDTINKALDLLKDRLHYQK